MKQIGLAVLCSVVLCLSVSINSFGQIKAITKEQYDAAEKSVQDKIEGMLRRVITVTTNYKADKIDNIETLTIETFPNGDERWNSVTKTDGQIINKLQIIYFGKYEYRKEGESDWKKTCIKDCSEAESGGGFSLTRGKELPKVEEYLLSNTTVYGQTATLYLYYRVYQLGAMLNFYESRLWIGSNGLILKEESMNSDAFPTNKTSSVAISYEYNPKDVAPLEAPIK